jgi:hypothetical protein
LFGIAQKRNGARCSALPQFKTKEAAVYAVLQFRSLKQKKPLLRSPLFSVDVDSVSSVARWPAIDDAHN